MPPVQPIKLEELLERLGSKEAPIDCEHRYALRRALLNSPYFESHRQTQKWTRVFGYATSALAGGMAVMIVVVSLQVVYTFSQASGAGQVQLADAQDDSLESKVRPNRPDVEVVSNPLKTLDVVEIPRVVPVNVMNFVGTDLNVVSSR
jgi:hypothetical protein